MRSGTYRNISFAAAESLRALVEDGAPVEVRGSKTKELRNQITVLERPLERCLFLPNRENNIFTTIAETMWVLAGRNDVAWLSNYLPAAARYSDDGVMWRGGYGPRLRAWHPSWFTKGVDQIGKVRELLSKDRLSRRGVIALFDPTIDLSPGKDIPCNNWLNWLIRDDHLHLSVGSRSSDAILGFSGVNAFEWSVLHEMMAFWLNTHVGDVTYFSTSFHLYENDYERANDIIGAFPATTFYDFGLGSSRFQTHWKDFGSVINDWFVAEEKIRENPDVQVATAFRAGDPFLASALRLLRLKWGSRVSRWSDERLRAELHALPEDDFAAAAYELLGRRRPHLLEGIPQQKIADFFADRRRSHEPSSDLKKAIKILHARKNRAYGGAWKRRGERISVLPNIARKIDRLEVFVTSGERLQGETILDTAIDLFVYLEKYRLLLAEAEPSTTASLLPTDAPRPFSDHDLNFEHLVTISKLDGEGAIDMHAEMRRIISLFEDLWPAVDVASAVTHRMRLVAELSEAAARLISAFVRRDPITAKAFVCGELYGGYGV